MPETKKTAEPVKKVSEPSSPKDDVLEKKVESLDQTVAEHLLKNEKKEEPQEGSADSERDAARAQVWRLECLEAALKCAGAQGAAGVIKTAQRFENYLLTGEDEGPVVDLRQVVSTGGRRH